MKESLQYFLRADKGGKGKQKKGDSTSEWVVEQLQHPNGNHILLLSNTQSFCLDTIIIIY